MLVGVDVGASHTEAAIGTDATEPLARVRRPGLTVRSERTAQAAETISGIIEAALQVANPETPVVSIVVGSAGTHTEDLRSELESRLRSAFPHAAVHITTDGAIALESAFGDRPGIVVCAGSGTIAYARDPHGAIHRVGGLGPILADEGSGYAIGSAGIRAAARAADGRSPSTSLMASILAAVDVTNLDELISWAWSVDRPAIAALAQVVCNQAGSGDGEARTIIDTAASDLRQLAISLARHFDEDSPIDVAFSGGILSLESPVRDTLQAYLIDRLPQIRVMDGSVDPVLGALSMAERLAS